MWRWVSQADSAAEAGTRTAQASICHGIRRIQNKRDRPSEFCSKPSAERGPWGRGVAPRIIFGRSPIYTPTCIARASRLVPMDPAMSLARPSTVPCDDASNRPRQCGAVSRDDDTGLGTEARTVHRSYLRRPDTVHGTRHRRLAGPCRSSRDGLSFAPMFMSSPHAPATLGPVPNVGRCAARRRSSPAESAPLRRPRPGRGAPQWVFLEVILYFSEGPMWLCRGRRRSRAPMPA